MAGHGSEEGPSGAEPRVSRRRATDSQDQQHEEHDHERSVEHADRRDDPADGPEDRLGELEQERCSARPERAAADREPRQDRPPDEDDEVEGDRMAEDVAHGSGLEQAPRLQPLLLLLGDLDVARREQEHLVGDALHRARRPRRRGRSRSR